MLGDVTTPLSMIVVGAILGEMNIKEVLSSFPAYYSSVIRLLVIPFVVMGVLKLAGVGGITLGVLVMLSAMPVAANSAIISSKYGADSVFASKCIFISTVLSTLSIPLLMMFVT
jgi:predicted permease